MPSRSPSYLIFSGSFAVISEKSGSNITDPIEMAMVQKNLDLTCKKKVPNSHGELRQIGCELSIFMSMYCD